MKIRIRFIKLLRIFFCMFIILTVFGILVPFTRSQDRIRSLDVKWLCVSDLHNTFAIEGSEFEMHRTGYLSEQCDGLRWPAQYLFQDCSVAKSIRIGTTNFFDPVSKIRYPYKVVGAGPASVNPRTEIMPVKFKLIGRFSAPEVTVNGEDATDSNSKTLSMKLILICRRTG